MILTLVGSSVVKANLLGGLKGWSLGYERDGFLEVSKGGLSLWEFVWVTHHLTGHYHSPKACIWW